MIQVASSAVKSLVRSPEPISQDCLVRAVPVSPPTDANHSPNNTTSSTFCDQLQPNQCEAITKTGKRCRANKGFDSRFCFFHDPDPEVSRARLTCRRKGGLGGILPDELHKAHRAQEHADLRKLPPADFRRVIRLVYKEFCWRQKRGDVRDRAWPRVGDRPT